MRTRTLLLPAAAALGLLAACGDRFSPDVYATRAVQQADKVEQGIVVGVRQVRVSAEGSTGAAAGAAAGGVLGAQTPGGGIVSALGGVGGALVGGIIGKGAEHTVVDTNAYEYIVRTSGNTLMRVTQQDREPLRRGQQVLLIMGSQARVVPDYTQQEGAAPGAIPPATGPGGAASSVPAPSQGSAPAQGPGVGAPETSAIDGAAGAVAQALLPHGSAAAHAAGALLPPTPGYPSIPPAPPAPRAVDTPVTGG